MENNFEKIIDKCIDRLNQGDSIEACLADYPEYAVELKPLLLTMINTKSPHYIIPSADRKRLARQRFLTALEKRQQPVIVPWFRRTPVWATVTAVFVMLLIGYFALRATILPASQPVVTIVSPNPSGNFAFLVSDDVNAISDFSDLFVTIEIVNLLPENNDTNLIEFIPDIKQFDLSLLPGEKTLELWRGDIPQGKYSQVVIYVSEVYGTLKNTGERIDIKLPSNKLQINKDFNVQPDILTSFVYDLTVIKTGNINNTKYILKPQINESGATQQPGKPAIQNSGKWKEK
jgi:hypothetical protein